MVGIKMDILNLPTNYDMRYEEDFTILNFYNLPDEYEVSDGGEGGDVESIPIFLNLKGPISLRKPDPEKAGHIAYIVTVDGDSLAAIEPTE